jgi:hypothetical protein
MKINRFTWMQLLFSILSNSAIINAILLYHPNIPLVFIVVLFLSALNGFLTVYFNKYTKSQINAALSWLVCILVNIFSLFITYTIYIIRSGTIIKYPGDLAINVIMASFIIAIVTSTIVYWITVLIISKCRK